MWKRLRPFESIPFFCYEANVALNCIRACLHRSDCSNLSTNKLKHKCWTARRYSVRKWTLYWLARIPPKLYLFIDYEVVSMVLRQIQIANDQSGCGCAMRDAPEHECEWTILLLTHRLAIIAYWPVVLLRHLCSMVVSAVPYSKVHLVMAQNHCSRSIQSTSYTEGTYKNLKLHSIWANLNSAVASIENEQKLKIQCFFTPVCLLCQIITVCLCSKSSSSMQNFLFLVVQWHENCIRRYDFRHCCSSYWCLLLVIYVDTFGNNMYI